MNQRYYSSQVARFLTPDPYVARNAVSDPQAWNRYAYVQNDPVNVTDRNGLNRWACETSTAGDYDADCVALEQGPLFYLGISFRTAWSGTESTTVPTIVPIPLPAPPPAGSTGGGGSPKRLGYNGAFTGLSKPDCYRMFGFSSGAAAQTAFDSLTFQWQRLGALQVEPVPGGGWQTVARTPPAAQNDPGGSNTVVINVDFNWFDFSNTLAVNIKTGQAVPGGFDYLSGLNSVLNTNMTTSELSSLILLHEFRHTAAGGNQASEPNDKLIHDNCIR